MPGNRTPSRDHGLQPGCNPDGQPAMSLDEQTITCPYCWESISLLLDVSLAEQDYVEDCSVCCHPIEVRYQTDNGELISLSGTRTDD